jgi:nitrate reductase delta subunit
LSAGQRVVAWQAASLVLDYPDQALLDRLDLILSWSRLLPAPAGDPLREVVVHLASGSLTDIQAEYVETFDTLRRCNLFLTYFAHGDTRKRGMALLRLKQTYLGSGFVLDDAELPDHLCVVLEYAATIDQRLGYRILLDHRAGLELLRISLRDAGSPWAGGLEAVSATLPTLTGDERSAVQRLASAGPPEEEVGLAPFASPTFSAGSSTTLLPVPTVPGRRA